MRTMILLAVSVLLFAGCLGPEPVENGEEGEGPYPLDHCPASYPDGSPLDCTDQSVAAQERSEPFDLPWTCVWRAEPKEVTIALYDNQAESLFGIQYEKGTMPEITGGVVLVTNGDGTSRLYGWEGGPDGRVTFPAMEGDEEVIVEIFSLSAQLDNESLPREDVQPSWSVFADGPWPVYVVELDEGTAFLQSYVTITTPYGNAYHAIGTEVDLGGRTLTVDYANAIVGFGYNNILVPAVSC